MNNTQRYLLILFLFLMVVGSYTAIFYFIGQAMGAF